MKVWSTNHPAKNTLTKALSATAARAAVAVMEVAMEVAAEARAVLLAAQDVRAVGEAAVSTFAIPVAGSVDNFASACQATAGLKWII